ncbi:MAG: aspartate aminotransferase family protein [Rhodospirillales bacterium]
MPAHNEIPKSIALFEKARQVLPGGTTRATVVADPSPIYIQEGRGPRLIDVDGNSYLDLVNNYTALIHGHGFQPVVEAVKGQIGKGSCFANPTELEILLSQILCERVPGLEKLRFVTTGTEATMYALKAARAYTGRTKIAKFEGAYHGAYDYVETSENSGPDNWGPISQPARVRYATGTPDSVLEQTVIVPFNDIENTLICLERAKSELACLLVDLVPSRGGLIPLEPDYIAAIQDFCKETGILIVSDEVLNFRQGYGGAAAAFGLEPDLITIGKIIGGGLPIALVGGGDAVMEVFDSASRKPLVPQGGTFAANPLSLVAGIAAMTALDRPALERLNAKGERLRAALRETIATSEMPISVTGAGSLFRLHMRPSEPRTYREFYPSPQAQALNRYIVKSLLGRGIYLPETSTSSLTTAMEESDLAQVVAAFRATLESAECRDLAAPIRAASH